MFKKIHYPKIIAPFLIIASFFAMVTMQIFFEKEMIAKEIKLLSTNTELFNNRYPSLIKEARGYGFKQDETKSVLIVNFWASWCQPCLREFASMKKLLRKTKNVQILGVNQDETPRKMLKAQKKYKLPFFSYLDIDTKMADSFKVKEYPYSIIYCKGKVLKVFEGETNFNSGKVKRLIRQCR